MRNPESFRVFNDAMNAAVERGDITKDAAAEVLRSVLRENPMEQGNEIISDTIKKLNFKLEAANDRIAELERQLADSDAARPSE